ncbi:Lrp/AsnC family transcriptional regulator [Allobranchiibius sp. GilTou73]|uniref:Lrp/AsnC family transcriptional regulator n=1 Tax=Allobranchiibius sp. GilTou73 TaxID=2904523 RepID=UPI001F3E3205|nr:Lrp/AsnC family transcriptional regulator [Allobranchiibius sp. GilTou73]UIJ35404.1 Lrp/AsnC family transcriptional regulator [Allobranchiibius sp. GilTou73]
MQNAHPDARPLLDDLDVTLLELLTEHPRIGVLELSRMVGVTRATVGARMDKLRASGVVTGYGPQLDVVAAGYPVQAMVTLEIAQGDLDTVTALLQEMPGVLEAYSTTGTGDVVVRLAAASNDDLQQSLLVLGQSEAVRRSTSVVVLATVVSARALPLLRRDVPPTRTSTSLR